MKVIIAGSRHAEGNRWLRALKGALDALEADKGRITLVISGTAKGMDTIGESWAAWRRVPVQRIPADWGSWGRSAGPRRNGRMVAMADALVCLHDGGPGSADVMRQAREKGLVVVELDMREPCAQK